MGRANLGQCGSHYTIYTSKGEMINCLCQLPKNSRTMFKCLKYFSRVLVFSASGLHPPSLVCQPVPPLIYVSRSSTPSMSPSCHCHHAFPAPQASCLQKEIIHLLVCYMQNKLFLAIYIYHLILLSGLGWGIQRRAKKW